MRGSDARAEANLNINIAFECPKLPWVWARFSRRCFPKLTSDVCSCHCKVFPYRLPHGNLMFPTACRKKAEASFPSPLAGPYRLEGATLAHCPAASSDQSGNK